MRVVLAALVALSVVPGAQAQGEALDPQLEISAPFLTGEAEDGIGFGSTGKLSAPWSITFATAANAAAELGQGTGAIAWSWDCSSILDLAGGPTVVEHVPGETGYEGSAVLDVHPKDIAPGATEAACDLTATFTGANSQDTATAKVNIPILYHADLSVDLPDPSRQAGPQKQIPFPVLLTNNGNARTIVRFELPEQPGGRWAVLLPDPVVLEPHESKEINVVVATPYKNGYTKDSANITLQATPFAAADETQTGQPVSFSLQAGAEGVYVPGTPGPLLAFALVGLAGALRRRR